MERGELDVTARRAGPPQEADQRPDDRAVDELHLAHVEDEARVQWDVLPQMQVTLNRRQHIMINVGVRIPVNERTDRSTRVITYFLWNWFDGGLLDGW